MKDELFEKSIETLELPRVLELLSHEAVTDEGKERALALRPLTDSDDVERALAETSAAVDLVSLRGAPYFGGVKPVRASLQRADMGGSLNTRELLEVAAVLRCARSCMEYAADSREKTPLDPLFGALPPTGAWRSRSPAPSSPRRRSPTPPALSWPTFAGKSGSPPPESGTFSRS